MVCSNLYEMGENKEFVLGKGLYKPCDAVFVFWKLDIWPKDRLIWETNPVVHKHGVHLKLMD